MHYKTQVKMVLTEFDSQFPVFSNSFIHDHVSVHGKLGK